MEAQSLSTCNICGKKFQRKAHLLRHQQQRKSCTPINVLQLSDPVADAADKLIFRFWRQTLQLQILRQNIQAQVSQYRISSFNLLSLC
jgi:hypothetical protein